MKRTVCARKKGVRRRHRPTHLEFPSQHCNSPCAFSIRADSQSILHVMRRMQCAIGFFSRKCSIRRTPNRAGAGVCPGLTPPEASDASNDRLSKQIIDGERCERADPVRVSAGAGPWNRLLPDHHGLQLQRADFPGFRIGLGPGLERACARAYSFAPDAREFLHHSGHTGVHQPGVCSAGGGLFGKQPHVDVVERGRCWRAGCGCFLCEYY